MAFDLERAARSRPADRHAAAGASGGEELPFVSIVMPVRNEADYIESNLTALLDQEYPADRIEVIVADGRSTDGTPEVVAAFAANHPSIRLIDNPGKIVSAGLNRAVGLARGEVIVRLDGHCEYPKDYVRKVVSLLERTGAANAGGVLVPMGSSYVQRAICAAYSSPAGIGGAALRARPDSADVREVDAVHGGCWRRETLNAAGLFDEEMVRNQDDELSFRIRKAGGRILQAAAIRVRYAVRDSWRKLFLQFAQYGYWKVRLIRKHPRQASLRHFAPALFVLLLLSSGALAPFSGWARRIGLSTAALYLLVSGTAALAAALRSSISLWPGIVVAFLMMHVGYGWGFLLGALRLLGLRVPDAGFSRLTR
jgi:glycosyltransferase involved in cell wall biosynthesis